MLFIVVKLMITINEMEKVSSFTKTGEYTKAIGSTTSGTGEGMSILLTETFTKENSTRGRLTEKGCTSGVMESSTTVNGFTE